MPPAHPAITFDAAATRRRIDRLKRYVTQNLLDEDDFLCARVEECRASVDPSDQFREGTMSHIGNRFDLTRAGKPLRVMVVGQESGLPKDPASPHAQKVSLNARREQIRAAGVERRYYASNGHQGRNPHMRGTTSALRRIFGKRLGSDYDGEFVLPENGCQQMRE